MLLIAFVYQRNALLSNLAPVVLNAGVLVPVTSRRVADQRDKHTEEDKDREREEGDICGSSHGFPFTDLFSCARVRPSFASACVSDRSDQAAARIFIRSAGDDTRLLANASSKAIINTPPTATQSIRSCK